MTGSFLDTTIVVSISDPANTQKAKCQKIISSNQPSTAPYYAIKELLVGPLQNLCDVHNSILAAENMGEALLALSKKNFYSGRKKDSKLEIAHNALDTLFRKNFSGPRDQMKQEALEWLSLRINRMWMKAKNPKNVDVVQSLSCLNYGKLTFGLAGEIRGPSNSFNCYTKSSCSAAAYLYEDKIALSKMIKALHPSEIDPSLANKQETKSRRKALKELEKNGPAAFHKGRCRALGDAYFSAMCPAGSVVATTNIVDFEPLCLALGVGVVVP